MTESRTVPGLVLALCNARANYFREILRFPWAFEGKI
jgi:hypothetical protein